MSDLENLKRAFENAWSAESSSKWKKSNPALGQCGVTALVAQDCLGGDIVKTWVVKPGVCELWHYYNLIDEQAVDFTISQFDEPIQYDDIPSSRDEALRDAWPGQYDSLRDAVKRQLADPRHSGF